MIGFGPIRVHQIFELLKKNKKSTEVFIFLKHKKWL